MAEVEKRNLILGALALHDKIRFKDIGEILDLDEKLIRELIYAMGTEPWFKDFGRVTGSYGKEEWKRKSVFKTSKMQASSLVLSDSELSLLGLMIHNKDIHLSYLANLVGFQNLGDLRKSLCKLAAHGILTGTLTKERFRAYKTDLPEYSRIRNLDDNDKMILGSLIVNPVTKLDELPKEIGFSKDEIALIRRKIWKLLALGCIFYIIKGSDYVRAISETEMYMSLSRIYPRPKSTNDFCKKLVGILGVRGKISKEGRPWLPVPDLAKEMAYEDERFFRRAIYREVGRGQILVFLDQKRKFIYIPKDTPSLLPVEEKPEEEEIKPPAEKKPMEEKIVPSVEELKLAEEEESRAEQAPAVVPEPVEEFTPSVIETPEEPHATSATAKETATPPSTGKVSVLRGGEVVADKYVFKVKVMNDTPYNITNVVVTLAAYPVDCLAKAPGSSELKRVNVIESSGFTSPTFTLRPTKDCVKGTIKAIVNYVDHLNELQTLKVEPQEISMVCGLLKPLVIEETEFDGSIKDWLRTSGNVEVRGMNPKLVFEKARDVLTDNNFHVVASHEVPVEKEFVGIVKGFAQGKYSRKRLGVALEIRGELDGEDTFIKVESSAEEDGMIAPAMQEVLDGFRKPRLFGKKGYYDKLSGQVLRILNETSADKGGICSMADLNLAISKDGAIGETSMDSIEEAVRVLSKKGLIGGIRSLTSGVKIVEVKPMELSQEVGKMLELVSESGVITSGELIQKTNWAEEAVKTALGRLESSGIARKVMEEGGLEKWYFPAFYKPTTKEEKQAPSEEQKMTKEEKTDLSDTDAR